MIVCNRDFFGETIIVMLPYSVLPYTQTEQWKIASAAQYWFMQSTAVNAHMKYTLKEIQREEGQKGKEIIWGTKRGRASVVEISA